ncbi:MAG: glycosyltransferase [Candidatus Aminicenantes bacterium]|nr:glycosyltransferase [Candidatus Aminicenantes bacterium]
MKIAIISTYDNYGGASIATLRLHKGLRSLNRDFAMIVRYKNTNDPDIYAVFRKNMGMSIEEEIFKSMENLAYDQNRTDLSNTLLSLPYPGYDLSKTGVIRDADIINLHWTAHFQSVESITSLLNLGKPVVWTLHDQNAFTGGCHYSAGCIKYREDCRDCPQLKDNCYQIPFHILNNKVKNWQHCRDNLVIVTPSRWLADCARESKLFRGLRVETIPNSLETEEFMPLEKKTARKELDLGHGQPGQVVLLFGAVTGNEKRKGFQHLVQALRYCLRDPGFKYLAKNGGVKILTFGPSQGDLKELDIEIQSIGYIDGNRKLAALYSASDLFVLPSLEDNLPNTMLESMACGTPVVSFAVGGMPDLIQDGVTGGMAPCFDTGKLGQIILDLVFDADKREQMGRNCRQVIEKNFKLQDQAANYIELFNELTKVFGGPDPRRGWPENNKKSAHSHLLTFSSSHLPSSPWLPEAKDTAKEIFLDEWAPLSMEGEGFFEIYRKASLNLLINWMGQKRKWQEQVKQGNKAVKLGVTIFKKTKKILKFVKNRVIGRGKSIDKKNLS